MNDGKFLSRTECAELLGYVWLERMRPNLVKSKSTLMLCIGLGEISGMEGYQPHVIFAGDFPEDTVIHFMEDICRLFRQGRATVVHDDGEVCPAPEAF